MGHHLRFSNAADSVSGGTVCSNMKDFKEALNSLENRVKKGEVVFKSADKGDVTTAMTPHFYHSLCMRELQKQEFYVNIGGIDRDKVNNNEDDDQHRIYANIRSQSFKIPNDNDAKTPMISW